MKLLLIMLGIVFLVPSVQAIEGPIAAVFYETTEAVPVKRKKKTFKRRKEKKRYKYRYQKSLKPVFKQQKARRGHIAMVVLGSVLLSLAILLIILLVPVAGIVTAGGMATIVALLGWGLAAISLLGGLFLLIYGLILIRRNANR